MDEKALIEKISSGESATCEFKRCRGRPENDTFETVCSFANHMGGNIYLDVADDGEVLGIPEAGTLSVQRNIANVARNPKLFSPVVTVETEAVRCRGKIVIRVWVPMSPDVHSYKGTVYDRVADTDVTIRGGGQLSQLYLRKSGVSSERRVYPYLAVEDLDPVLIAQARNMATRRRPGHPWGELSDSELLRSAGLWQRNYATGEEGLTLAAGLLFGTDDVIRSIAPSYRTDALLRLDNTNRYDDRLSTSTNLIDAYRQLMTFCEQYLPDPFHLEGDIRVSLRSVVCRELVSNMLIHREYSSPTAAQLEISRDGIRTRNASRTFFQGRIRLDDFSPVSKNPLIASVFTQVGLAEELGSGTRNLYKYSRPFLGRDPILEDGDIFRAWIPGDPRNRAEMETNAKIGVDDVIMELVANGAETTVRDVAERASVTPRTASSHLNALANEGLLEATGSTRDRRYHSARKGH
ncbi:MAG: ArsR family transcriptional regulator [Coriobacteriaceae bacterium]|nr:putative DNA binding domain-containing protein [Olsenella sp.]RRF89518.1 MAG: ArsR family transcriptional regulator [Coriobacteriaceae bacterium]